MLFLSGFELYSRWVPLTFFMEARENECQISQNYILHMKFSEFYLCNHNSCEI